MQKHEFFYEKLIIILSPILISINIGSVLSGFGSFIIIVYYLSKLKKDVVNADYDGSWISYFKSILKR